MLPRRFSIRGLLLFMVPLALTASLISYSWRKPRMQGWPGTVIFSPSGRFLAAEVGHGRVLVWDATTDPPTRIPCSLRCSTNIDLEPRYRLHFGDDATLIAPMPDSQEILRWDLQSNQRRDAIPIGRRGTVTAVSRSGLLETSERRAATADIWDLNTKTKIATVAPQGSATSFGHAEFTADETYLMFETIRIHNGDWLPGFRFYETGSWQPTKYNPRTLSGLYPTHRANIFVDSERERVLCVGRTMYDDPGNDAVAPSGRLFAFASNLGPVRIYDITTGGFTHLAGEIDYPVSGNKHLNCKTVCFSSDGRWLATATPRSVRLWDAQTFEPGPILISQPTLDWFWWTQFVLAFLGFVACGVRIMAMRFTKSQPTSTSAAKPEPVALHTGP